MDIAKIRKKFIEMIPQVERDIRIYGEAFISASETGEVKLLDPADVILKSGKIEKLGE
jgi:hypothetical protein